MKTRMCASLITIVTLFACNHPENFEGENPAGEAGLMMVMPPAEFSDPDALQADDRKLVKEGTIHFETSDLKGSRALVDSICRVSKSYISEEKATHSDWDVSESMTLRVPASAFDQVIFLLESHAISITAKDIKTKDVTEEFIDVKARLNTRRALEERYLQLLKKAGSMEEMLKVESALASVRSEIESMEGRLRYLNSRVSYSTLQVSYFKTIQAPEAGYLSKVTQSIVSGWDMVKAIFLAVVFLWPFIIFFTLVMVGVLRFRKSRSKPTVSV